MPRRTLVRRSIYVLRSEELLRVHHDESIPDSVHRHDQQLEKRVWQHKNGFYEGFTSKYKLDRLVWYETWGNPGSAIRREKQIKGWKRTRKIALIVAMNPEWRDLSQEWGKAIPPLKPTKAQ